MKSKFIWNKVCILSQCKNRNVKSKFTLINILFLSGIFFQDAEIVSLFKCFPEVLLGKADTTHKLNDQNMPLYHLFVVDEHGESHLVASFLVVEDDEATLRKMLMTFQEYNHNWIKVKTVVTDKDFAKGQFLRLDTCYYIRNLSFSDIQTI